MPKNALWEGCNNKLCKIMFMLCWGLNVKAGYTSRVESFQGFELDFMNKGETLEGLKPGNKISFTKITLWALLKMYWGGRGVL